VAECDRLSPRFRRDLGHRRLSRSGGLLQASLLSSYRIVLPHRPLRYTAITRFIATMGRSDSRPGRSLELFIPPRRGSPDPVGEPPRRASQVPQPIFLRALSPLTPRSPAAACAHCFTTSVRFHPHRKTDHFPFALTRPKRFHLRYGSRIRRSRLRRRDYSRARSIGYLSNGQLQDKLLSAYTISQVLPGTPMSAPPTAETNGCILLGAVTPRSEFGLSNYAYFLCSGTRRRYATLLMGQRGEGNAQ